MRQAMSQVLNKLTTAESYKDFPNKKKLNRTQYKSIISKINQKIFEYNLTTGKAIITPTGKFEINKFKTKKQNKHLSYKLKKIINYTNLHTDGYSCKYVWTQTAKWQRRWTFKIIRTHTRRNFKIQAQAPTMCEYIREHGVDHFQEHPMRLRNEPSIIHTP